MPRISQDMLKSAYIKKLIADGNIERAELIASKPLGKPLFGKIEFLYEEEPSYSLLNNIFTEIGIDIITCDAKLAEIAENYEATLQDFKQRMNNIETIIRQETEKLHDINILCAAYPEFYNIIPLSAEQFTGSFSAANNTLFASTTTKDSAKLTIMGIAGNGYEGNKYVINNGKQASETLDASNREYITDESLLTYYEYSRLISSKHDTLALPEINYDDRDVFCSIYISSEKAFNTLEIASDFSNINVEKIAVSSDGKNYVECANNEAIGFSAYENNLNHMYNIATIQFPSTLHVKLGISSNYIPEETLAMTTSDKIIYLPNYIKRKVIRINNMYGYNRRFAATSNLETNELLTRAINCIALFANEHIPSQLSNQKAIKYTFEINGKEYPITPINSQQDGIKVIKTNEIQSSFESVVNIEETIKSAKLKIRLNAKSDVTPYLSNIKICVG